MHQNQLRLVKLDSLKAMITTYKHEINSPLSVALTLIEHDELNAEYIPGHNMLKFEGVKAKE